MTYEYKVFEIPLDPEAKKAFETGLADINSINAILEKTINEKSKDGWEPLHPFSFPSVWFKRVKNNKGKK